MLIYSVSATVRRKGERGGPTVWRRREEGRGVVPPCGGRGRGGRSGTTVWRMRDGGEGRLSGISEITTCLIRGSMV